jgi:hypothetical protein
LSSSRSRKPAGSSLVRHEQNVTLGPGIAKGGKQRDTPAQLLRAFRVRLGWTIGRAATAYGCTADTWTNYEHGRTRVPADALVWIYRCAEVAA